MSVIVLGVAAGVGVGLGAARLLQDMLYGSAGTDMLFFLCAALVVAGAGLLATWLPARRAATIDPLIALRNG